MKFAIAFALVSGAVLSFAAPAAAATTINFDNLAVGTVLSNQYAAQGVTFSANAFTGTGAPTGTWATNTNMGIVAASGQDVGGLGNPQLVSGNILRSFNGWLVENGDPSFSINFTTAVNSVSLVFAGIATPSSTRIFAYNGATLLGSVGASATGQQLLSFTAPTITSVRVTPGDFFDWVGVDNLTFNQVAAVPEPATWAMMFFGFGLVGGALRRRSANVRVAYAAA